MINNMSRSIEAVFFKVGARNVPHRRNKMTPVVCCHDSSFAADPV